MVVQDGPRQKEESEELCKVQRARGMDQVVEHLSSNHSAAFSPQKKVLFPS
jgi:hypothetical protein